MPSLPPRLPGSAIAVTLIAVAAMTTITLGVAQLVPRDFRQSQALENALVAQQAAWAGVEQALLALRSDPFYELSQEKKATGARPYGAIPETRCQTNPLNCPGLDRQLGEPRNQTPLMRKGATSDLASSPDVGYSLLVWHLKQGVGTPSSDLTDGQNDTSRSAPNTNPILERDQVRVLDVTQPNDASRGLTQLTLKWSPVFGNECAVSNGTAANQFSLLYTWLDADGNPYMVDGEVAANTRDIIRSTSGTSLMQPAIKVVTRPGNFDAPRLSLRFLASDPDGNDDSIAKCFMRYSIDTGTGTADLGFSVVESIGMSGGTRRKVRVTVDRQNGRVLNILDFGVVCQGCSQGT